MNPDIRRAQRAKQVRYRVPGETISSRPRMRESERCIGEVGDV